MGSYLKHVTQDDPERKARLMKELDGFLERDRDRGLFDLPPNKEISDGNSGSLPFVVLFLGMWENG